MGRVKILLSLNRKESEKYGRKNIKVDLIVDTGEEILAPINVITKTVKKKESTCKVHVRQEVL